jgi:superfamily I DNA/RNA helicase
MQAYPLDLGLEVVEQKKAPKWSEKKALLREPQWSDYQKSIFEWVANGKGNLRVGAVAGSGKTTSIIAIVARLPKNAKIQILAFNKHIADSLKGFYEDGDRKLPDRAKVSTAHSLGNSLIIRKFISEGHKNGASLVAGKYWKIARSYIKELDISEFVPSEKFFIDSELDMHGVESSLTGFSKSKQIESEARRKRGIEISKVRMKWTSFAVNLVRGCQSTLCEPTKSDLAELIEYYGINKPIGGHLVIPLIRQILNDGEAMASSKKVIDYGDMLWLPYRWNLQPDLKDWVLIDEVQDANRAQLHLYEKIAKNGRVIVVGDEDQAIQGFAFASPQMWSEIGDRFQVQDLPLSVCYRCPTSHLDLARYFVPSIEPSPNAKKGTIKVVHPSAVGSMVREKDLVLCRFTQPLIDVCFSLLSRGIPATIRGREIGSSLAKTADIGVDKWTDFVVEISQILGTQIQELIEEGENDKADRLSDELSCLIAMHQAWSKECNSLDAFIEKIESIFSDEDSNIILSTIHRSKGDEADRVFILECNFLPYSKPEMPEWQLKQEANLAYVALTRAKESLMLVPSARGDLKKLMSHPYGGMGIKATALDDESILVTPYTVGDRFSFLGCHPYTITAVIQSGDTYEYAAEYAGSEWMRYWKCETYSHNSIEIIK